MRHDPDALMLFAAGFGTRMGALTQDRPKPLLPVGGRALLDHALDLAAPLNWSSIVVNAHFKADQIATHLANRPDIHLSVEHPMVLETGGGLRHALPLLGAGPVTTLNTDAVWAGPNPLALLRAAWNPDQMDALLLLVPGDRALGHTGHGDFIARNGRLRRGAGDIYTGAQIIQTDLLPGIRQPAFSLNVVWDQMLATNRLFGLIYPGQWCDVGRPDCIPLAERMLANV